MVRAPLSVKAQLYASAFVAIEVRPGPSSVGLDRDDAEDTAQTDELAGVPDIERFPAGTGFPGKDLVDHAAPRLRSMDATRARRVDGSILRRPR